jgi:hypothetical protein
MSAALVTKAKGDVCTAPAVSTKGTDPKYDSDAAAKTGKLSKGFLDAIAKFEHRSNNGGAAKAVRKVIVRDGKAAAAVAKAPVQSGAAANFGVAANKGASPFKAKPVDVSPKKPMVDGVAPGDESVKKAWDTMVASAKKGLAEIAKITKCDGTIKDLKHLVVALKKGTNAPLIASVEKILRDFQKLTKAIDEDKAHLDKVIQMWENSGLMTIFRNAQHKERIENLANNTPAVVQKINKDIAQKTEELSKMNGAITAEVDMLIEKQECERLKDLCEAHLEHFNYILAVAEGMHKANPYAPFTTQLVPLRGKLENVMKSVTEANLSKELSALEAQAKDLSLQAEVYAKTMVGINAKDKTLLAYIGEIQSKSKNICRFKYRTRMYVERAYINLLQIKNDQSRSVGILKDRKDVSALEKLEWGQKFNDKAKSELKIARDAVAEAQHTWKTLQGFFKEEEAFTDADEKDRMLNHIKTSLQDLKRSCNEAVEAAKTVADALTNLSTAKGKDEGDAKLKEAAKPQAGGAAAAAGNAGAAKPVVGGAAAAAAVGNGGGAKPVVVNANGGKPVVGDSAAAAKAK